MFCRTSRSMESHAQANTALCCLSCTASFLLRLSSGRAQHCPGGGCLRMWQECTTSRRPSRSSTTRRSARRCRSALPPTCCRVNVTYVHDLPSTLQERVCARKPVPHTERLNTGGIGSFCKDGACAHRACARACSCFVSVPVLAVGRCVGREGGGGMRDEDGRRCVVDVALLHIGVN